MAVEEWSELEAITCEVDDLSVRHRPATSPPLIVTVAVHVPEHPTDEEQRLYEQLRVLGRAG